MESPPPDGAGVFFDFRRVDIEQRRRTLFCCRLRVECTDHDGSVQTFRLFAHEQYALGAHVELSGVAAEYDAMGQAIGALGEELAVWLDGAPPNAAQRGELEPLSVAFNGRLVRAELVKTAALPELDASVCGAKLRELAAGLNPARFQPEAHVGELEDFGDDPKRKQDDATGRSEAAVVRRVLPQIAVAGRSLELELTPPTDVLPPPVPMYLEQQSWFGWGLRFSKDALVRTAVFAATTALFASVLNIGIQMAEDQKAQSASAESWYTFLGNVLSPMFDLAFGVAVATASGDPGQQAAQFAAVLVTARAFAKWVLNGAVRGATDAVVTAASSVQVFAVATTAGYRAQQQVGYLTDDFARLAGSKFNLQQFVEGEAKLVGAPVQAAFAAARRTAEAAKKLDRLAADAAVRAAGERFRFFEYRRLALEGPRFRPVFGRAAFATAEDATAMQLYPPSAVAERFFEASELRRLPLEAVVKRVSGSKQRATVAALAAEAAVLELDRELAAARLDEAGGEHLAFSAEEERTGLLEAAADLLAAALGSKSRARVATDDALWSALPAAAAARMAVRHLPLFAAAELAEARAAAAAAPPPEARTLLERRIVDDFVKALRAPPPLRLPTSAGDGQAAEAAEAARRVGGVGGDCVALGVVASAFSVAIRRNWAAVERQGLRPTEPLALRGRAEQVSRREALSAWAARRADRLGEMDARGGVEALTERVAGLGLGDEPRYVQSNRSRCLARAPLRFSRLTSARAFGMCVFRRAGTTTQPTAPTSTAPTPAPPTRSARCASARWTCARCSLPASGSGRSRTPASPCAAWKRRRGSLGTRSSSRGAERWSRRTGPWTPSWRRTCPAAAPGRCARCSPASTRTTASRWP